jgi:N-acetylglucosaminyl-diphospho-decaprenol L-rhamnosyltransferase
MTPDLSIIIVNYNTCALLDNCLRSIFAESGAELEIIVVDNGSTDGSLSMVKTKYPYVKLIENNNNLGFAKANNQGFKVCTGQYVMYLNSDTIVKPLALEKIISFMKAHPEADLMGPRLLNEDGSLQVSALKLPNVLNSLGDLLFGFFHNSGLNKITSFYDGYEETRPVGWISGACVVATGAAMEKLGGWDENIFMYSEDVLLGVQAHRLGLQVWYYPEAKIIHLRNRSSKIPQKRILQIYESRIKVRQMIFKPFSFNLFLWYTAIIMLGRASAYLMLYLIQTLVGKDNSVAQGKVDNYLAVVRLFIATLWRSYK